MTLDIEIRESRRCYTGSVVGKNTADTARLPVDPQASAPAAPPARKKSKSHAPIEIARNQQVGRFGLIRELARGGMGQVFLARDTKLGRKVAIKFLLDDNPSFVGRFLIEARATALCTHENIVTIFEVGEHQGLPFMVLEYLEGKTLTELLTEKVEPRRFAELMVPVAHALERAHAHGIVHRDLKPGNIFVTERGVVKVLDFGIAKLFGSPVEAIGREPAESDGPGDGVEPTTYVTFSGQGWIVGTLPYMSPEQWGVGEVDQLSDLWAIGILFWRALTGVHPAGTGDPVKLHARMTDVATPLPSIGTRAPELPRPLVEIVDRCLQMDKAKRYQNAAQLAADLQAFLRPTGERVDEDACPYRGLSSFGEDDTKYFFGRTGEIRAALAQLESWPLLAVIGPSGVGKSSFVHAGLIPAVRATGTSWHVRVLRPGRAPLTSLANVLVDEAVDPGEVTEVVGRLHDAPGQFGEVLRRQAARDGTKVLIVVDQLEELFTLSDDPAAREAFLAALLGAADDPSSPVRVVLSMRADFLDRLAGHTQFLAALSRGLFFLSAPDRDTLRETLIRPAQLAGYKFEAESIIEHIVQTATSRGALPLLQFAATKLWDARDRERKLLTLASYDAMGGVAGAFARHADEVAGEVPPQHQPLLRALLKRLVTPEGTRAVVDRTELLSLGEDEADVARILDQLVRARLVHVHSDPTAGTSVEMIHEALITEWPMLQRWLEDSHALRAFLGELRQAARTWSEHDQASDLVWRGAPALEAIALADRHDLDLDLAANERAYLTQVRRQHARGRRRRIVAFATVFAVLLCVIALGAIAVLRISNAEQLAHQKASAADAEAERARAAETESARRLADFEAEAARRRAAEAQVTTKSAEVKLEEQRRVEAELAKKTAELAALKTSAEFKSSREDHEVSNAELELAVEALERERGGMQRLVDETRAMFEDIRQSNLRLQQRVQQLEKERRGVAGSLK